MESTVLETKELTPWMLPRRPEYMDNPTSLNSIKLLVEKSSTEKDIRLRTAKT
jgi:hypothetical protein